MRNNYDDSPWAVFEEDWITDFFYRGAGGDPDNPTVDGLAETEARRRTADVDAMQTMETGIAADAKDLAVERADAQTKRVLDLSQTNVDAADRRSAIDLLMAAADPNLFKPPLPELPVAPTTDATTVYDGIDQTDYDLWQPDGTYAPLLTQFGEEIAASNTDYLSDASSGATSSLHTTYDWLLADLDYKYATDNTRPTSFDSAAFHADLEGQNLREGLAREELHPTPGVEQTEADPGAAVLDVSFASPDGLGKVVDYEAIDAYMQISHAALWASAEEAFAEADAPRVSARFVGHGDSKPDKEADYGLASDGSDKSSAAQADEARWREQLAKDASEIMGKYSSAIWWSQMQRLIDTYDQFGFKTSDETITWLRAYFDRQKQSRHLSGGLTGSIPAWIHENPENIDFGRVMTALKNVPGAIRPIDSSSRNIMAAVVIPLDGQWAVVLKEVERPFWDLLSIPRYKFVKVVANRNLEMAADTTVFSPAHVGLNAPLAALPHISDVVVVRVEAVSGLAGGSLEILGGSVLLGTPEPTMVTKVAGTVFLVHGIDGFGTNAVMLYYGKRQQTRTSRYVTAGAAQIMPEEYARYVGPGTDMVLGIAGEGVAIYKLGGAGAASPRALRGMVFDDGAQLGMRSTNAGGSGLFKLLDRPVPGLRSTELQQFYLEQVMSPKFAARLKRYNRLARMLGLKEASVQEIAAALKSRTTFHTTHPLFSAIYPRPNLGAGASFRIQGNAATRFFPRSTAWHESAHLGAALNGQTESILHEVAVHFAMSPELLGTGFVTMVIAGRTYYVIVSP